MRIIAKEVSVGRQGENRADQLRKEKAQLLKWYSIS